MGDGLDCVVSEISKYEIDRRKESAANKIVINMPIPPSQINILRLPVITYHQIIKSIIFPWFKSASAFRKLIIICTG